MIAFLLFFSSIALAGPNLESNAKILNKLSLPAGRVEIRSAEEAGMDGPGIPFDTVITVREPITFLGNTMVPGTIIFYGAKQGISSISTFTDSPLILDGIPCRGNIRFLKSRLCGCDIAKVYTAGKNIVLPVDSKVGMKDGKLEWFMSQVGVVRAMNRHGVMDRVKGPIVVGGLELNPLTQYTVRDGKVVKYPQSNNSEYFCGETEGAEE